jgi:hypothetical protein
MNISKIERKLERKIRHIWKKIETGYTIEYSYNDGYDEYGALMFVCCKNGFEGGIWEINQAYDDEIKSRKLSILDEGLMFNGNLYYIHPQLYFKEYDNNNLVEIISKEEHIEIMKIKTNIENIIKNIKETIKLYNKEEIQNIHLTSDKIYNSTIFYCAKNLLNSAPLHNYYDFVNYFSNNKYYNKSTKFVVDILNSPNFKNEREILGLGKELIK